MNEREISAEQLERRESLKLRCIQLGSGRREKGKGRRSIKRRNWLEKRKSKRECNVDYMASTGFWEISCTGNQCRLKVLRKETTGSIAAANAAAISLLECSAYFWVKLGSLHAL